MGAPVVSRRASAAPHNRAAHATSPCAATTLANPSRPKVREVKRLNSPPDCAILSTRTSWRESMELTDSLKSILRDTAKQLKGRARRIFLARIVKELGPGGASRAERELGWDRKTVRKGTHEVDSGITCLDAFGARGRKLAEEHLPNLLLDLKAIVDGQSQTDPQFKHNRLGYYPTKVAKSKPKKRCQPPMPSSSS